jgi:hypothetical protein
VQLRRRRQMALSSVTERRPLPLRRKSIIAVIGTAVIGGIATAGAAGNGSRLGF